MMANKIVKLSEIPLANNIVGDELLLVEQGGVSRVILTSLLLSNLAVSASNVPIATPSMLGKVKPDGTSITISSDGAISAIINTEGLVSKNVSINNYALSGNINLTASDIGLGNVSNLDFTNASNITKGVLDVSRIPIASSNNLGVVKVDGDTITINNGVISSVAGTGNSVDTSTFVQKSLKINNHPLSGNITLSASDVGLDNVANVDTRNPSNIIQTANYRFVTDVEKDIWNNTNTPSEKAANGERVWVIGYGINDGQSVIPDQETQSKIDNLILKGWPIENILWDYLGDSTQFAIVTSNVLLLGNLISNSELVGILPLNILSINGNIETADLSGVLSSFGMNSQFSIGIAQSIGVSVTDSPIYSIQIGEALLNANGALPTDNISLGFNLNVPELNGIVYSDGASVSTQITIGELVANLFTVCDNLTLPSTITSSEVFGVILASDLTVNTSALQQGAIGSTLQNDLTIPCTTGIALLNMESVVGLAGDNMSAGVIVDSYTLSGITQTNNVNIQIQTTDSSLTTNLLADTMMANVGTTTSTLIGIISQNGLTTTPNVTEGYIMDAVVRADNIFEFPSIDMAQLGVTAQPITTNFEDGTLGGWTFTDLDLAGASYTITNGIGYEGTKGLNINLGSYYNDDIADYQSGTCTLNRTLTIPSEGRTISGYARSAPQVSSWVYVTIDGGSRLGEQFLYDGAWHSFSVSLPQGSHNVSIGITSFQADTQVVIDNITVT